MNRMFPIWLITLAAITFGAIAPFFAVHNPSIPTANNRLSATLGEQILICSGDGFKWVKLSDLRSGKEKPAPHSGDKCPLCNIARHSVTVPAPLVLSSATYYPPEPTYIRYDPVPVFAYQPSPLNSRAPPYFLIG
jgi:hypothetical protein